MADQLRANSGLKPSEYSRPVLGLLFLRYAEGRFAAVESEMRPRSSSRLGLPGPDAYKASNLIYLSPEARFSHLLQLPDGANLGRALNLAMEDIEKHNPDLADALPKNYDAVSFCTSGKSEASHGGAAEIVEGEPDNADSDAGFAP